MQSLFLHRMRPQTASLVALLLALLSVTQAVADETIPVLKDGKVPASFNELWGNYDPRREPLETEVLKEWEEDGVVLRIVRYRIGIFKGQKAMMAAVYGFPKGGSKLPGLVQIHGGGQFADYKAPLTNAKRGYATISIAWAGRISAPDYQVDNDIVKLFWDGKTNDPAYKVTTDWGPLDGYHAPSRDPKTDFSGGSVSPSSRTLDDVDSPRNNPWFLEILGARRALTFLEQQPEIDPEKLGVYGHSMGGKITVLTAGTDSRVKAAAPSCGGLSHRNPVPIFYETLSDPANLSHITCPILFLSPANDFHGRIDDLQKAITEIKSQDWRITSSPHHNHQDTAEYEVAGLLWFDQYLKGTFHYPQTPAAALELKTKNGVPSFAVTPDSSRPILSVDIYYTQQGQKDGEKDDRENTMARFWHHANAKQNGKTWTAALPLLSTNKPLWVYANVLYPLDAPVTGVGYYYGEYTATQFNLSSRMSIATPELLAAAGVKATVKPSLLIETFAQGWQKEWFTYDLTDNWARKTHKLYDPKWQAPVGAKLAFDVRAAQTNRLVIGLDDYAAEVHLKAGGEWQSVILIPTDFHNAAEVGRSDWNGIRELRLGAKETLRIKDGAQEKQLDLGANWQGAKLEFRNLRWIENTERKDLR